MRQKLRSGALTAEECVELTIKGSRALAVAAARFHAGTFEGHPYKQVYDASALGKLL
jgi:hypothetical protein